MSESELYLKEVVVQVKIIASTTISLYSPLRYEYSQLY